MVNLCIVLPSHKNTMLMYVVLVLKTGKFKPQFWQHYYHVALYLLEW
jgi:hypothetical protein